MVGHVAQSVGGALPNVEGSPNAIISQTKTSVIGNTSIIVPEGAFAVFAEVLAQGGRASNRSSGGGAAATDGVFAVTPGETLTVTHDTNVTTPGPSVLKRGSTTLLSADAGKNVGANNDAPATAGKYSGGAGFGGSGTTIRGGRGGGRLAGERGYTPWVNSEPRSPGDGSGAASPSTSDNYSGGWPVALLSFFATEDAATVFAKTVVPGWVP